MRRLVARLRRCAVPLLCAFAAAASARGQEQVIVHMVEDRQVCSIKVAPFAGAVQIGGFGCVLVDVLNHDDRPHAVQIQYLTPSWAGADVQVTRRLGLAPQERSRFHLPLPNTMLGRYELRITVDSTTYYEDLHGSRARGLVGLFVSERANLLPASIEVLQAAPSRYTDPPEVQVCSGVDLPGDWRWLTGFHAVVVDGRAALGAEPQETLRRLVHAGGRVVVAGADRLPVGSLRDLCGETGRAGIVSHGFGQCVVIPALGGDTAAMREQMTALSPFGSGLWPLPENMLGLQPIPGLGQAPVLGFLSVMLLFAVLVGPVNFLLLRKWRRPMLALVTVPALGCATTVLMVGYGMFHDGFGVRGVLRSWSVLDQGRHEVAAVGARTLFAGLSPSELSLGEGSLLVAPVAFQRQDRRSAYRWHFDADTGLLDGGVLASRTPTTLVSGQQGVARQRLRVRLRADGRLDLLADGGVQPHGEVLVRGPDGAYWCGQGAVLQACTPAEAEAAYRRWRLEANQHTVHDLENGDGSVSVDELVLRMAPDGALSPGSYVARVAAAPWLDEHGLDVDYELKAHFVLGTFGAEDFLR